MPPQEPHAATNARIFAAVQNAGHDSQQAGASSGPAPPAMNARSRSNISASSFSTAETLGVLMIRSNPLAAILSLAMLLRQSLGEDEKA